MTEEKGIKELTEVEMLALQATDSLPKIFADEKISLGDMSDIWDIFQRVGPAALGIKYVPAEVSDLSLEELDTLIDTIDIGYKTGTERSKEILMETLAGIRSFYKVSKLLKG